MNIYFRIQTIVQFLAQSVPKENMSDAIRCFPAFSYILDVWVLLSVNKGTEARRTVAFLTRVCSRASRFASLKGLDHAILGNFSMDQVVIELTEITK